ncbi:hypothetical protein [Rheinheimera sp.]|uniref:hypothetical protein n=1 Tax=Rheinheimera sp. TaxID=1869214 RepID=UPI0040473AF1
MCGYCIEANFVIGRLWRSGVLTTEVCGEEADWLLLQILLEVADIQSLNPSWLEQAEKLCPELLQLRQQEAKPCALTLADIIAVSNAAAGYFIAADQTATELDIEVQHALQEAFYRDFNRFWLALHHLAEQQPGHKILVDIAVAVPGFVPDLPAYELALQRKLLRHCVSYYGIEFVAAYLQQLRPELIAYLADRLLYQADELQYLLQLLSQWQGEEVLASRQDVIDHLGGKLAAFS